MLIYKTRYHRRTGFTDKFYGQFIFPQLSGIENKILDSKNEAKLDSCKFLWTSSRINYFQDFKKMTGF